MSGNVNIGAAHKMRSLLCENRELVSVVATEPLRHAITIMVNNDYSQIPVVKDGGERARRLAGLKGVVSWSSIGERIIKPGLDVDKPVSEFMHEPAKCSRCSPDALIMDVVQQLQREGNEYVIVVDDSGTILGMVTHYDIAQAYADLVRPFTEIECIEIALRNVFEKAGLTTDDINGVLEEIYKDRPFRRVTKLDDLDFAQYVHVFGKLWDRLDMGWTKAEFIKRIEEVHAIRNRIMHFRPGGISDQDKQSIKSLRKFLQV